MPTDIWGFVFSTAFGWVLAGIVIYLLDRQWGVRIYPFLYDLFHKAPMPKDQARGFFVGQPSRSKVARALILAGVLGLLQGFYTPGASVVGQIIVILVQAPALLVGFMLGKVLSVLLPHRNKVLDSVDWLGKQASKENVERVAREAGEVGGNIVDSVLSVPKSIKDTLTPESPAKAAAPEPPAPPAPVHEAAAEPAPAPPQEDARSAIDRFTRRS